MSADQAHRHWRARLLAVLATVVAALALALPATALAGDDDDRGDGGKGGDDAAVALNDEDGSTVLDFAFSIRRVAGDVVDDQNAAVALASCVSCQTVAVAIQIVLVDSTPSVVTPVNAAIALNEECTACTTVALAYQYVLGVGQPLRFTKEGRERIREIRKEFLSLERSDLPLDQILARVAELRAELVDVLNTQLEIRPPDAEGDDDGDEGDDDDDRSGEGGDDERGGAGADRPDSAAGEGDKPSQGSDDEPSGGSGGEPSKPSDGGGSADTPSGGGEAPAGGGGESSP